MINRLYTQKRPGLSPEAQTVKDEIANFLGIDSLEDVEIINRYDVEDLEPEVFEMAKTVVFSEPQVDTILGSDYTIPEGNYHVIAVESLPGQFDQRADSCSQSIQLLAGIERPIVSYAKIYQLKGDLTEEDLNRIKSYLINPVESREASLEKLETLKQTFEIPTTVDVLEGFIDLDEERLQNELDRLGLAMDLDDLKFLQDYFKNEEHRNPTITEVRVIDTYWSDHCRHTTFGTYIDSVIIDDPDVEEAYKRYLDLRDEVYEEKALDRPVTLMDLATLGAKVLKKRGLLKELDESEEINACSIRIPVEVDGKIEDWLIMYKNETHNHPTEIEPFGGAATCIGGCIRDPLSGRSYVYQAMRLTGGGDPRAEFKDTLEGRLPQRKIAQTAAQGYSSYGNQIGLATGLVDEVYHPGYLAKHFECGAVVGAAPAKNIRRERPTAGDVIILLGGRTGRDGIGGATGSSKEHNLKSLTTMASEVQKGNAPEERKLQRLFRNKDVTKLIKRCNDFGAGGVSVAIGELADGLEIDLDQVRKKYEGLDGTELAISESQERMAVVVAKEDVDKFIDKAQQENLEAYPVAVVTEEPRMKMTWNGEVICDLSRDFLNSNGAVKHTNVLIESVEEPAHEIKKPSLSEIAKSLKSASRRGLTERFDGSIGAGSLLMPYGGKYQRTPEQVMAALIPLEPGSNSEQATVMSYGFDPDWKPEWFEGEISPYFKAYDSVVNSLAKLVAAGADYNQAYLSLQEFFERMSEDPKRWGLPFESLLGALDAQIDFNAAAIGGKDSMSGTFLDIDVPPTVVSFAIAPILADEIISSDFKEAGNPVYLIADTDNPEEIKQAWDNLFNLEQQNKVLSSRAIEIGGIAEALMQMSFGNMIGFKAEEIDLDWYKPIPSGILVETTEKVDIPQAQLLGYTTEEPVLELDSQHEELEELLNLNETVLSDVYPVTTSEVEEVKEISYRGKKSIKGPSVQTPRVVIPVFPGTNCEYDSANLVKQAGLEPVEVIIKNQSPESLKESAKELKEAIDSSHILFIPGGFSGGDEPEGSGKFIASFLRNPELTEAVNNLIEERQGLVLGICNGFQALIKLGLVPYGKITDVNSESPTLTYNTIGRHQSKIVHTKISSDLSPWFSNLKPGEVYEVPISHGEGRFIASEDVLNELIENGQIATQYVDLEGNPSMDTSFNPNGSVLAIEAITSPDGRVLGKMGHSERYRDSLYKNVPGNYEMKLFESAKEYFK